jgi:hypothetical protein
MPYGSIEHRGAEKEDAPPPVSLRWPVHGHVVLADKPLPPQKRVATPPPHPDFHSLWAHVHGTSARFAFKQAPEPRPAEPLPARTSAVREDADSDRCVVLPLTPRTHVSVEAPPAGRAVLGITAARIEPTRAPGGAPHGPPAEPTKP